MTDKNKNDSTHDSKITEALTEALAVPQNQRVLVELEKQEALEQVESRMFELADIAKTRALTEDEEREIVSLNESALDAERITDHEQAHAVALAERAERPSQKPVGEPLLDRVLIAEMNAATDGTPVVHDLGPAVEELASDRPGPVFHIKTDQAVANASADELDKAAAAIEAGTLAPEEAEALIAKHEAAVWEATTITEQTPLSTESREMLDAGIADVRAGNVAPLDAKALTVFAIGDLVDRIGGSPDDRGSVEVVEGRVITVRRQDGSVIVVNGDYWELVPGVIQLSGHAEVSMSGSVGGTAAPGTTATDEPKTDEQDARTLAASTLADPKGKADVYTEARLGLAYTLEVINEHQHGDYCTLLAAAERCTNEAAGWIEKAVLVHNAKMAKVIELLKSAESVTLGVADDVRP